MLAREKRSAIVVTSSGLGIRPVAGIAAYSASKAYASSFAQALSYETEGKIDVVDWACGEVSTKLMPAAHRHNPRAISTEAAVKGLLRSIGHDRVTSGARKHETANWMFSSAPLGPVNRMMYSVMSKSYR